MYKECYYRFDKNGDNINFIQLQKHYMDDNVNTGTYLGCGKEIDMPMKNSCKM